MNTTQRFKRLVLTFCVFAALIAICLRNSIRVQAFPNESEYVLAKGADMSTDHNCDQTNMKRVLSDLELMSLDANSLQRLLSAGQISSRLLVLQSLTKINKHDRQNENLRAMISVAPKDMLLLRADKLDRERASGHHRGPFHGIPIIVKDSIKTAHAHGLPTTAGTIALAKAVNRKNAGLVDKLESAGAIILGKTNMNELCNWKGVLPSNGLSAIGGQTQSAYVATGFNANDGSMGHSSPCGSSSGSAVGVSAGYSPLSIGSETFGSLVSPATRAALFSIKPTVGSTITEGIWTLSDKFDAVGGMTRSVVDLADITHLLQAVGHGKNVTETGYRPFLTGRFDGLRVGFLDPAIWRFPPEKCKTTDAIVDQMNSAYFAAIEKIRAQEQVRVEYPVPLPESSELQLNGTDAIGTVINSRYADNVEAFLKDFSDSPIYSLKDMIGFNQKNAQEELPGGNASQQLLITAYEKPPSNEEAEAAMAHLRNVSRTNGVDKTLREYDVNLLAFPMDSWALYIAAAAGYPIATMPLGILDFNGRPFALGIIAQEHREDLMFQFMSAFEQIFPRRSVPVRLLGADQDSKSASALM